MKQIYSWNVKSGNGWQTRVMARAVRCFTWSWSLYSMTNLLDLPSPNELAVRCSLLHLHLRSHVAVHHLHHLHYQCVHLLLLVQSFILNLRLGSLANRFHRRPFFHLPDWFHRLSEYLTFLFCSTAGLVCMLCSIKPALSRFSSVLEIYAISSQFDAIYR